MGCYNTWSRPSHLHSTMVSINRDTYDYDKFCKRIYIPLWYLLIVNALIKTDMGNEIYIPLWYLLIGEKIHRQYEDILHLHSTMVSINQKQYAVCLLR